MPVIIGRRELVGGLGCAAVAWPLASRAQQEQKIRRIGIIDDTPIWDHFRSALRDLGHVEGKTIAYEYRTAEGEPERLAVAAAELVHLPVDVIAVYGTAPALAAMAATKSIPIVAIGRRSGAGRACGKPCAPWRQCHRQYRSRSGHRRQADAASQRGHPSRFAGGLSLESRQRLACRLPRRAARRR